MSSRQELKETIAFWLAIGFLLLLFLPPIIDYFTASHDLNVIIGWH